jgi:hypothetical protein
MKLPTKLPSEPWRDNSRSHEQRNRGVGQNDKPTSQQDSKTQNTKHTKPTKKPKKTPIEKPKTH